MPGQSVDMNGQPPQVEAGAQSQTALEQPMTTQDTQGVNAHVDSVDDHRQMLNRAKEGLISLGAMARWEADHLFDPIFTHLAGR